MLTLARAAFDLMRRVGSLCAIGHKDDCVTCIIKPKLSKEPIRKAVRTVFHSMDMKIMQVCRPCWDSTLGSGDPDIIHLEVLAASVREAKELADIQKIMSG